MFDSTAPIPESQIDWQQMYEQQRKETEKLRTILTAAKVGTATSASLQGNKPEITAAHLKASLNPVQFLNLSRDEKLRALKIDPTTVSDDDLHRIFGRGANGAIGADLMKVNPGRYRLLREAAQILNIYGA